jgi:hypothetical protein
MFKTLTKFFAGSDAKTSEQTDQVKKVKTVKLRNEDARQDIRARLRDTDVELDVTDLARLLYDIVCEQWWNVIYEEHDDEGYQLWQYCVHKSHSAVDIKHLVTELLDLSETEPIDYSVSHDQCVLSGYSDGHLLHIYKELFTRHIAVGTFNPWVDVLAAYANGPWTLPGLIPHPVFKLFSGKHWKYPGPTIRTKVSISVMDPAIHAGNWCSVFVNEYLNAVPCKDQWKWTVLPKDVTGSGDEIKKPILVSVPKDKTTSLGVPVEVYYNAVCRHPVSLRSANEEFEICNIPLPQSIDDSEYAFALVESFLRDTVNVDWELLRVEKQPIVSDGFYRLIRDDRKHTTKRWSELANYCGLSCAYTRGRTHSSRFRHMVALKEDEYTHWPQAQADLLFDRPLIEWVEYFRLVKTVPDEKMLWNATLYASRFCLDESEEETRLKVERLARCGTREDYVDYLCLILERRLYQGCFNGYRQPVHRNPLFFYRCKGCDRPCVSWEVYGSRWRLSDIMQCCAGDACFLIGPVRDDLNNARPVVSVLPTNWTLPLFHILHESDREEAARFLFSQNYIGKGVKTWCRMLTNKFCRQQNDVALKVVQSFHESYREQPTFRYLMELAQFCKAWERVFDKDHSSGCPDLLAQLVVNEAHYRNDDYMERVQRCNLIERMMHIMSALQFPVKDTARQMYQSVWTLPQISEKDFDNIPDINIRIPPINKQTPLKPAYTKARHKLLYSVSFR